MKLRYLYSIMCIFSLLALSGCREEEAVQTSEGTRTVTVNLGIAMSRAEEDDVIAQGEADDMSIWIYDQDGKSLQYKKVDNPKFTGVDIAGNPIETVTMDFDITDVEKLQFRVLMNTDNINITYNDAPLTLDATTSIEAIESATFSWGTSLPQSDNKVPMYGKEKNEVIISNKRDYNVEIEVKRAVSKLELFFTKESESSSLAINKITLTNIPDKGFLAREITATDITNYNRSDVLFDGSNNQSLIIDQTLPASESQVGDFSNHPANFMSVTLSQPYLLENPNNKAWDDNKQTDYEYPDPQPSNENAYILQVDYTLDGTQKTQAICLPEIKRNVWNKIYARVTSSGYELLLSVNPWDMEDITVDYENNLSYVSQGWGNTILGYLNEAKTQVQINPNQPAVLTFMINSPSGALWRATLSNYTDFQFVGPSSGAAYTDEKTVPQIIQIEAVHSESDERYETELHVYADIGGITYEMDLTNPSAGEIKPGDAPVNYFTIIQSR